LNFRQGIVQRPNNSAIRTQIEEDFKGVENFYKFSVASPKEQKQLMERPNQGHTEKLPPSVIFNPNNFGILIEEEQPNVEIARTRTESMFFTDSFVKDLQESSSNRSSNDYQSIDTENHNSITSSYKDSNSSILEDSRLSIPAKSLATGKIQSTKTGGHASKVSLDRNKSGSEISKHK
jgi:hypothetical protein